MFLEKDKHKLLLPSPDAGLHQSSSLIESDIYPCIKYCPNPSREFICQYNIPGKYRPFHFSSPLNQVFYQAVAKIFEQIGEHFGVRDLWICQQETITYPVLVYFKEASMYPCADCCHYPAVVEFVDELSGRVKCSECQRVAFGFAHVLDKKGDNRHSQKHQDVDKQNERLYKQMKLHNEMRKSSIQKLICSNQHRYKSFKKILSFQKSLQNLVKTRPSSKDQRKKKQTINNRSIFADFASRSAQNRQSRSHFDAKGLKLGEFIIEMDPRGDQYPEQLQTSAGSCRFSQAGQQEQLSESREELKQIISDIFS